ncbi:MAG: hypothetical protein QW678_02340 [Candidatus Aenigmatarchaeota archaeon]
MKLQSFIDYLISISTFFIVLFVVLFFSISTFFNIIDKYSFELSLLRSFTISQQLIFYNGSSDLKDIIGLSTGRYNEINYSKLQSFINNCNNNKKVINELFLSSDFYISIDNFKCNTITGIPTIKRIVVINNQIKIFEIGIKI